MKLVNHLPFESEFLASCKFLAPHNQANPRCERWVVTAAQSVPSVISSEERSSLEVEAHLQQTAAAAVEEDSDIDIVHFWKGIYATQACWKSASTLICSLYVRPTFEKLNSQ